MPTAEGGAIQFTKRPATQAVRHRVEEVLHEPHYTKLFVVIPNCLDGDVFVPMDQAECRRMLGLPLDKNLFWFGAFNPFDRYKLRASLEIQRNPWLKKNLN